MDGTLNALEILERCRGGADEIRQMEDTLAFRRDTLTRCTQSVTGMPRGGAMEDKIGTLTAELMDGTQRLNRRRRAHAAERCAAVWILDMLPERERAVMQRYYCQNMTLRAIAAEIHYSLSSVNRFRARGEAICAEITPEQMAGFLPEWYENEAGE